MFQQYSLHFLELLKENDYKSITIDELCQKAEISRNTFYLHYDNKQDLIDSIVEKHLQPIYRIYEKNYKMGNFCTEIFEKAIYEQIEYVDNNKYIFLILFKHDSEIRFSKKFVDILENIANKNKKNLGFVNKVESDFCMNYINLANVASMKYWLENYDKYTSENVFKLLVGLSDESLNFICKRGTKK